jgi:hypothetical protein
MYKNADLDVRFGIQCALDPDAASRRWFLQPLDDSLIDFKQSNADLIRGRLEAGLKDAGVRVFQGAFEQVGSADDPAES